MESGQLKGRSRGHGGTRYSFLLVLVVLCVLRPLLRSEPDVKVPESQAISAAEVWERVNGGERILIIDVRDELERSVGGHIPGDIAVPFHSLERFAATIMRVVPDRRAMVVLYCKGGIPVDLSAQANGIMAHFGYVNASYISGGFDHWPYDKVK